MEKIDGRSPEKYAEKKQRDKERLRIWRAQNPKASLERDRAWRAANREKKRQQDRESKARWRKKDPENARQKGKEHYIKNPESYRLSRIKSKYGLSKGQYANMLKAQNNQCFICHKTPKTGLVIDHCHTTGKVRALLCVGCNVGLGHYERKRDAFAAYLVLFT